MRRFQFRLQTNLEVTRRREDILRQELKKRQTSYQEAVKELNRLEKLYRQLGEKLYRDCREGVAVEIIQLFKNYMQVIEASLQQQKITVEHRKAELEHCRANLLALVKKRKVMEKLRERRWQEYCYRVRWEEQKELDETATARFVAGQEA